jgi:hypothetical protein
MVIPMTLKSYQGARIHGRSDPVLKRAAVESYAHAVLVICSTPLRQVKKKRRRIMKVVLPSDNERLHESLTEQTQAQEPILPRNTTAGAGRERKV